MGMAPRKLELKLMVMELIILLVPAVVGRCMNLFGTHGGGANPRWWGELFLLFLQLIQERTATIVVGAARIARRNRHRDETASD